MVSSKQVRRKLKKQYYIKNRDSILKREKERYLTNQLYREVEIHRAKQNIKKRYQNDKDYRKVTIERAKQQSKQRYDNDEVYREAKIEGAK